MTYGPEKRMGQVRAAPAPPVEPAQAPKGPGIEIAVIFTTREDTLAALKAAQEWSSHLDARILLLAAQVVPRQFPLTCPPVSIDFTERRLTSLAEACQGNADVTVQLCLCRDKRQCLLKILKPESLVVIGVRKRWWPTKTEKLAKDLRARGHRIILVRGY